MLKKKKEGEKSLAHSYPNSLKALTSSSPLPLPPPWKNVFKGSCIGGSVYRAAAEWCSLGNRSAAITKCHMLFFPASSELFSSVNMQGSIFCWNRHWPELLVIPAKYAGTVLLRFGIRQSPCVRHLLALRKRQCSEQSPPHPLPPPVFGMHRNFSGFN